MALRRTTLKGARTSPAPSSSGVCEGKEASQPEPVMPERVPTFGGEAEAGRERRRRAPGATHRRKETLPKHEPGGAAVRPPQPVCVSGFQPGTLVRLRSCPHGEPGVVQGVSRRWVLVEWRDLGMTGKHPPENLLVLCPAFTGWAGEPGV